MQATAPQGPFKDNGRLSRNFSYFLVGPLTALVIFAIFLAITVTSYQSQHNERIYTGVSLLGVELGGMTQAEARDALANALAAAETESITFTDPTTGQQWALSPSALGVAPDLDGMVQAAYAVGRSGSPVSQLRDLWTSYYYGQALAPTIIVNEGQLDQTLANVAADINRPASNALFTNEGGAAAYVPSQVGRELDTLAVRQNLLLPLTEFRPVQVALPVTETWPQVADDQATAGQIQQALNNPITFYLPQPLVDADLQPVTLEPDQLAQWVQVEMTLGENGRSQASLLVDENAVRYWLSQYANRIYRLPVNARYYFDDDIEELVLVAPHVNGRELDIEATLDQFLAQVGTPNRAVPFVVKDIIPTAHSNATAAELGITELISEKVTWFYGSSDARKHNIARSAANFYGIVIAPYEEFSFNKYQGSISEADGYTEGLIIVGGMTIRGIGGGICQVSTTLYQTAFWAGFPIVERWEHGYWLSYYNDGEGPGMDATVYNDGVINVDLRFINNTPYHLLIENYYSAENEALTFKFYSTSMGRTIEKDGPYFENVTEVPGSDQDRWTYMPDLPPGTVEQIDYATEGAEVFVTRTVLNANGDVIEERLFVSRYIPYPNTFHYGPNVEPYNYSLVPPDPRRR